MKYCRRPQKGVSAPIAAGHPNYPTEILKRPASALLTHRAYIVTCRDGAATGC
jgi:hypothetical protein